MDLSVCFSRVALLQFGPVRLQDVARESFGQFGRTQQPVTGDFQHMYNKNLECMDIFSMCALL